MRQTFDKTGKIYVGYQTKENFNQNLNIVYSFGVHYFVVNLVVRGLKIGIKTLKKSKNLTECQTKWNYNPNTNVNVSLSVREIFFCYSLTSTTHESVYPIDSC